jgi:hypothetical protein
MTWFRKQEEVATPPAPERTEKDILLDLHEVNAQIRKLWPRVTIEHMTTSGAAWFGQVSQSTIAAEYGRLVRKSSDLQHELCVVRGLLPVA